MRDLLLISVCLAVLLGSSACTARVSETPPTPSADEAVEAQLRAEVAPPGIYGLPLGRTQVIGTLVRDESLEGGFWAIQLRTPAMGTDVPPIVVSNAEIFTQPPIAELEGAYVVAEGTISEGASVRMAGSELVADTLSRIEDVQLDSKGRRWLRGVPYRWARIEKPGVYGAPNGGVRGVGTLVWGRPTSVASSGSWLLLNEMPFGGGQPARTALVLTEAPFGDPTGSDWIGAYVEVTGEVIGTATAGERKLPIVRVDDASRVTTMVPTVEEQFAGE